MVVNISNWSIYSSSRWRKNYIRWSYSACGVWTWKWVRVCKCRMMPTRGKNCRKILYPWNLYMWKACQEASKRRREGSAVFLKENKLFLFSFFISFTSSLLAFFLSLSSSLQRSLSTFWPFGNANFKWNADYLMPTKRTERQSSRKIGRKNWKSSNMRKIAKKQPFTATAHFSNSTSRDHIQMIIICRYVRCFVQASKQHFWNPKNWTISIVNWTIPVQMSSKWKKNLNFITSQTFQLVITVRNRVEFSRNSSRQFLGIQPFSFV